MQAGRTKPSAREQYGLLYKITKGLDILLRHGIMHGDLKSQNIIITGNMSIKIFDFELSNEVGSNTNMRKNLSSTCDNPSHGYLYICTVLGSDIVDTIQSICTSPSEEMYGRILKVIGEKTQTAGARKRTVKRKRGKKVRWSRRLSH